MICGFIHVFTFEGVHFMDFETITIDEEYITLAQFLKLATIISSGGMAKPFLADYEVYLNDTLEDRRGKKLYDGDEVKIPELGVYFNIRSTYEAWLTWYLSSSP